MFIRLLSFSRSFTSIINASDHAKYISLNNQQCMTHTTLINSHPNGYIQGLHYYPFAVSLDRCTGSCNTLNDLSNWICFPNITEDINLNVFITITGKDKSKILIKHISCKCKYVNVSLMVKNVTRIKSGITISIGVSVKILKKIIRAK